MFIVKLSCIWIVFENTYSKCIWKLVFELYLKTRSADWQMCQLRFSSKQSLLTAASKKTTTEFLKFYNYLNSFQMVTPSWLPQAQSWKVSTSQLQSFKCRSANLELCIWAYIWAYIRIYKHIWWAYMMSIYEHVPHSYMSCTLSQKILCININYADVHTIRILYKFRQFVYVQKHSICSCIKCN